MPVSIGWVVARPELGLRLRGGSAGLRREIDLVVTTELESPFRWLSGGELVLTTGMRLPSDAAGRAEYMRGLWRCGVAGLGFGIGLTHDAMLPELVTAADELGLPLFEVPLDTAFAAIVKQVSARIAELQYDAVLRAGRAQPRMTRALIRSGSSAIVRELASSLGATVLVLDPVGRVIDCHPAQLAPETLTRVRAALAAGAAGAGVLTDNSGASITHQRIGIGRRHDGDLVVVGDAPLGHVDQVLLGHANSLLALDFEKPDRLHRVQHQLDAQALSLLLGAEVDPSAAWAQLDRAADADGRIKVLVAECDSTDSAGAVNKALAAEVLAAGHPLFLHRDSNQLLIVIAADSPVIDSLRSETFGGTRKLIRMGVSGPHPVRDLAAAVDAARWAASAAEKGGPPADFATLPLLSFEPARQVLDAMAHTVLAPLLDHDRRHDTALLPSLRAFLEANGQWESAAVTLAIHRHTLRKRIAATAEILDRDLDNARVRAELLLALHAEAGRRGSTRR
ncbi:PucR family transcriptional regulator [Nocardia seriolae]|uniref:PucR family transcriptional regulator n=1 Tax=Nocardia seriolae TaxID=37332 RepID=A0A0B8NKN3_9NOCA|nr:PucR family transcriptional regulator [Nocardia seriolae]APA96987.1 Transcriptional activator PmfR [Nocardia seriolae]MTJ65205.1 PucR family transcriptional regulator [Nocardia seriolae]MTJ75310.1 PucR family transcriptional regulator [Nocardia seriolae]MTJ86873.1 PucR family transcriptional regulator [Nocardia seriolae]MTK30868.1 PucR family transcriptional regulator [Nocardia seriolae]